MSEGQSKKLLFVRGPSPALPLSTYLFLSLFVLPSGFYFALHKIK